MADKYLGASMGKLGYGFIRLPTAKDGGFDLEPMKKMVDVFLGGRPYHQQRPPAALHRLQILHR